MNSLHPLGLLFLRITFSGMMLFHGLPKFMQLLGGDFEFADPIGIGPTVSLILAVIGEAIAPILVIVGLKTRIAAVVTAITMAIAAFVVHAADPMQQKELALLYLFAFVAIALLGPGSYSLDRK